jgi:hypothetical protein
MSSEYKRVFLSCAKLITPKSSKLLGDMLWHQQCFKNWVLQGTIVIGGAFNTVLIDWDEDLKRKANS